MTETQRSAAVALYASDQVGGPYIFGATAKPCTIGYRNARAEQYPEHADKISSNCPALSGEGVGCSGCKWDGRLAHDCAQLTRYAAQAAGLSLPSGATSQWEDGDWAASGLIADLPRGYVAFVYRKRSGKMVHTGILDADGTVVEARSHADGVIRSDAGDYPWTHWAILRGMACPPGAGLLQANPLLSKGARGKDVIRLQEALNAAGYSVAVDGIFGKDTRSTVMLLQRDGGIEVDGIVGEMTWALLDKVATGVRYTVTITGVIEPVAHRILRDYGGQMEVMKVE